MARPKQTPPSITPVSTPEDPNLSQELADEMQADPADHFSQHPWLGKEVAKLADPTIDRTTIEKQVLSIIKKLGG